MKRVRCPKCDTYITFDEKKYHEGQSLFFECPSCSKQFGIKIGVSKLKPAGNEELSEEDCRGECGSLLVIKNVFHDKQILPLKPGRNIIGKYMKTNKIECPIETSDPSVDLQHCCLQITRQKDGSYRYELSDGPSYTGTFVANQILQPRERRPLSDGTLFTIGATSIILRTDE